MKKIALALLALAAAILAAAAVSAPPTVLHVVVVKWKADSTPQQRQAAIDGVRKMAADVPGVKNVWVKTLKAQPADYSSVFAMEFETRAAFEAYTNDPAHQAWEKLYLPLREESNTQDVTN
jgi:ABC-type glycerol-3-phosphate transport system substrate-binding protein